MRKTRILGQGLEVSAIGLGCMGMDHAYGAPADREEMIKFQTSGYFRMQFF